MNGVSANVAMKTTPPHRGFSITPRTWNSVRKRSVRDSASSNSVLASPMPMDECQGDQVDVEHGPPPRSPLPYSTATSRKSVDTCPERPLCHVRALHAQVSARPPLPCAPAPRQRPDPPRRRAGSAHARDARTSAAYCSAKRDSHGWR